MSISIDNGIYANPLPISMMQPAPTVPTGSHSKVLSNFIFVEDKGTGAPSAVYVVSARPELLDVRNVSISVQLYEIKDRLGLNLSQLSKILDVSRPQLYKWLEGVVLPQREEFNHKISEMYSLLELISPEHCKYFGKLAKRYVFDQKTVLDVLSSKDLNKDMFLAVYEVIKSDIEAINNRITKDQQKGHLINDTEVVLLPE